MAKVPFDEEIVEVISMKQYSKEYKELNPNSQVPTLKDHDGFVVYESHTIMRYIAETRGNPGNLYPPQNPKTPVVNYISILVIKLNKTNYKYSSQLRSLMEGVFDCKICYNRFNHNSKKPMSLPCGHTFCSDCLKSLHKDRVIRCPLDNQNHYTDVN